MGDGECVAARFAGDAGGAIVANTIDKVPQFCGELIALAVTVDVQHFEVAPEGYAGIDFVSRKLHLVQVSDEVRRQGLRIDRMDNAAKARLKDEVFGRHLEVLNIDSDRKCDQLTAELRDFVDCVRHNRTPRVTGEAGRDALAIAHRVLESVRAHQWEGTPDGATGPNKMPRPQGKLFELPNSQSEAA